MTFPGQSGQLVNLPTGGSRLALKHGWVSPPDGGEEEDREATASWWVTALAPLQHDGLKVIGILVRWLFFKRGKAEAASSLKV